MKTVQVNNYGVTVREDVKPGQARQWDIPPDSVEAHFTGYETAEHPFNGVAKGDVDSAKDMVADFRRNARQDERNR